MHGVAIVVPPAESDEQLRDMMWRIPIVDVDCPVCYIAESKVKKM